MAENNGEQNIVIGENISDNPNAQVEYSRLKLPQLASAASGEGFNQELFGNIPVDITVELGKSQLTLQEVLNLKTGNIIELKREAQEPLDVVVNGQLIAKGEVVAVDDKYAIKITHIVKS